MDLEEPAGLIATPAVGHNCIPRWMFLCWIDACERSPDDKLGLGLCDEHVEELKYFSSLIPDTEAEPESSK